MNILIFASAASSVAKRAITKFSTKCDNLYVLIPNRAWSDFSDLLDTEKAHCIRLSADSFDDVPETDLQTIKSIPFNTAVIVSGGLGFMRFYNVIEVLSQLYVTEKLVFYNSAGNENIYTMPQGIKRVVEKYYALFMMKIFLYMNKIGLFFERIFVL